VKKKNKRRNTKEKGEKKEIQRSWEKRRKKGK
jgi:hypothetical protein